MRYRLRTLLIVLALGPPVLAGAWWGWWFFPDWHGPYIKAKWRLGKAWDLAGVLADDKGSYFGPDENRSPPPNP